MDPIVQTIFWALKCETVPPLLGCILIDYSGGGVGSRTPPHDLRPYRAWTWTIQPPKAARRNNFHVCESGLMMSFHSPWKGYRSIWRA